MKKATCLLLCLILVCGAFAGCNTQSGETTGPETTAPASPELKVGFGRVDITPNVNLPLGGHLSLFMSTDVREHIYASCIALTDEKDNTVLFFCLDLIGASEPTLYAKRAVEKATGVPATQMIVSTNHNHSAPDMNRTEDPAIKDFNNGLKTWMSDAAVAAMADRKPAKLEVARKDTDGLNFVRHYKLSDGSYAGDNFGVWTGKTIMGHATEVDNELQVLRFVREGAKDIVMANFQGHPTGHDVYKYSIMCHTGVYRSYVENALDCHFAYVLGASGNVNSKSRIKSENIAADYIEHGNLLGQEIVTALQSAEPVENTGMKFVKANFDGQKNENVTQMPVSLIAIGDFALVTAPYEMFCESGMAIKEGSPYKMTFVSTCTDGSFSYIPSKPTFVYGGYEVNSTRFDEGTAEKLVDSYLKLLQENHG